MKLYLKGNENTCTSAGPYTLEACITVIISEAAQPAEYTVVSGADVKRQKSSKEGTSLTVRRSRV